MVGAVEEMMMLQPKLLPMCACARCIVRAVMYKYSCAQGCNIMLRLLFYIINMFSILCCYSAETPSLIYMYT